MISRNPVGSLTLGALALACLASWMTPPATATASEPATTVVYLVRHAEKAESTDRDGPLGPPLNEAGRARAAVLVEVLAAEEITHIFSTDYRRTQETAHPLAENLGLKVESYDPRALEEFARRLRKLPGRHVVVGHSNTTPQLAGFLGGNPGKPIDEAREFDRLYIVIIGDAGSAITLPLRYGNPPEGK